MIESYEIDFYVISHNVYIQFDGVSWCGLDRTINEISLMKSPRDKVVLATMKRDIR